MSGAASDDTFDIIIIGDGPAGSALAGELLARDVDVVLLGQDAPWNATYGLWADEIGDPHGSCGSLSRSRRVASTTISPIVVGGHSPRQVDRAYVVADNDRLRNELRGSSTDRTLDHRVSEVRRVRTPVHAGAPFSVESIHPDGDARAYTSKLVVNCAGRATFGEHGAARHPAPAWQTAFGVVLPAPPDNELGRATLMSFASPAGPTHSSSMEPSFVYALPVADGWLVEETSLAARPAVPPTVLCDRLAARLEGSVDDMLHQAVRTEEVVIEMTSSLPDRCAPLPSFGVAGAMVHPATGYSVAATLRAAPRVADAIVDALGHAEPASWSNVINEAVWPPSLRATRRLHEFGLEVLLGMDANEVGRFFDEFFAMPVHRWAPFMRIDTEPGELSSIMLELFASAPWSVKAKLMSPSAFWRSRLTP